MEINLLPFDEIKHKFPNPIYKYRSWDDQRHKTILTEQIVYMAPPSGFEDPLDCKLPKRYDLLTDKEIHQKYFNLSKEEHPNWSRQQHRQYAKEWAKKGIMRDKQHLSFMRENYFVEYNKHHGVLSLTANPKNNAMWYKYADNFQGLCVGFDSKKMFRYLGGGGIVDYYETLPIIFPMDSFEEEHRKQVFSKEKKWDFEEEYRTHKFWQNPATIDDRKIKLPKDCYKEVIFGQNMTENHKNEIIEICQINELEVSFYNQILDGENISIIEFKN